MEIRADIHSLTNKLGAEHPDTLRSMYMLALNLGIQGRYEEAEKLFRETLELSRRVMGAEHLVTLRALNILFDLHCNVNKAESALNELSELLKYPAHVHEFIYFLTEGCVVLASISPEISLFIIGTIDGSPSKELFFPLRAAIGLYLGEKMRLPREVREIAKIIRERIKDSKF